MIKEGKKSIHYFMEKSTKKQIYMIHLGRERVLQVPGPVPQEVGPQEEQRQRPLRLLQNQRGVCRPLHG